MRKWIVLAAVAAALIMVSPVNAQGNKFKVYAAFNYVSPTGSSDLTIENIEDRVEASDEAGWSLGFEWRLGKWGGLEFDYLSADHDVTFGGEKVAETTMAPLTASFNFHLIHTKIIDFYLGPSISYVMWDDIVDIDGESTGVDSEWAYGAQVGCDFSLFKSVAIVTGLRWQTMDISPDDVGESLSVDPLYAKVGIAFRW
jgi:outer membrane protein W